MNRPFKFLTLTTVLVCLVCASGVVYAADPAPAAVVQGTSAPDPAPAPVASVAAMATPASSATSDTISLDFKDADIGTVLRVLSMKSNVNIVAGPEVKGLVTVRLDNVPWDKALDVILRTYNYVYEREGNIIRITTRENMKLEPVETKTFILNYSKASEIQASISDILTERGRIKVSERSNMVVVTDIPTNLYKIGQVIKKLDQPTSQAFIDSKVVRTEAGVAENLGIQWNPTASVRGASRPTTLPFTSADGGTPMSLRQFFPFTAAADTVNLKDPRAFPYPEVATGTSGAADTAPQFNYGTLDFSSFSATLQMLKSYTNSKVVSNPRVVVLNNQTANIQVGSDYPVPNFERNETTGSMEVTGFNYRELGVVLKVTPHINSAEEILVDLTPEISSFGSMVTFIPPTGPVDSGLSAPSFNVTKATTQVLIESGQTIAIGGLMSDTVGASEDKVPYLSDIPLLGKLFRSKRQTSGENNRKTETLFFVTVTTVDSQGQPVGAKVDGKDDQSKNDQAQQKTAATDAAPGVKDSEKPAVSDDANKDRPA